MDKKLKKLFDYQRFAQNKHLDEVVRSTLDQESSKLNDDVLFAVAGGMPEQKPTCPENLENPQSSCVRCIYSKHLEENGMNHCDVYNKDFKFDDQI